MRRGDISFGDAVRVWCRVGLHSFGGPAGQIAVMHRIVVDEKHWVAETRFLHAIGYCMLLPGPEAQQLATYLGWLLHGVRGGVVAGVLFVLPGFFVMLALSTLYVTFGQVPLVQSAFVGVKAAVLAIVVLALRRISARALRTRTALVLACVSFAGIRLFDVPFPAIVIAAGVCGAWLARVSPQALALDATPPVHGARTTDNADGTNAHIGDDAVLHTPSAGRAWLAAFACLLLWLAPVALLVATRDANDPLRGIATLFSRVAVVSFGGAYAVLAYVAQQAVDVKGWLAPGEMLDALALAETTPGPLVLVLQHVGFLAASRGGAAHSQWLSSALGAVIAAWVTFLPSFVWIFAGAPFIERLRGSRPLQGALAAITAAIVGVISSLALWFALHVVFAEVNAVRAGMLHVPWPRVSSIDAGATAISFAALVAALRGGVGTPLLLAGGALCGVAAGVLAAG